MKAIKKILYCLLLVLSFFVFSDLIKLQATSCSKINVHFYRYDNDYTNWMAWFWSESSSGVSASLSTDSEYGKKAVLTVTSAMQEEKLGILFVKSTSSSGLSWGGEQTDDIYFYVSDLEIDASGTANIYYVQGNSYLSYNATDAKKEMKEKFLYLSFVDTKKISYSTSGGSVTNLEVYKDDQLISSTLAVNSITINEDVDFSKTYTIRCKIGSDDVNQMIRFDGIYSSNAFNDACGYDGDDLGADYTETATTFKLWAPVSNSVSVKLYHYGHPTKYGTTKYPGDDLPYQTVEMERGEKGVWSVQVSGNLDGIYYTYDVTNGNTTNEVVDPYAKTTGVNGLRGMVVNFSDSNEKLNPTDWTSTPRAADTPVNVDKIIYETHMRDLTADESWGGKQEWAGTYLGLSQRGTTYTDGNTTVSTGLDHLIELGITHLHLLPLMDSEMVDETRLQDEEYKALEEDGIYNWGYMTKYFFSIDGCYSTDPYDGYARLYEYKTLIKTLHENGINVVMDVVFNHTSNAGNSNFHKIIPYYYHRTVNGSFSNGSGCGNEMASERYMVNKLIVDSVSYFAEEFLVDGFRFDLMALEDVDTMNDVYNATYDINPNTIIYGEPWTGGSSTGDYQSADKGNMNKMPKVAAFSDTSRNAIRGQNDPTRGWINANYDNKSFDGTVYSIVGGAGYFNSASSGYSFTTPNQIVNYASCHDNFTLFDQIKRVTAWHSVNQRDLIMNSASQALSIVLTSQGVPFIEGGSEIGRTKKYNHNSYNAGDETNAIKWNKKILNYDYFAAIRDLIAIRKNHLAFRQTTYAGIEKVMSNNSTLYFNDGSLIAYQLNDSQDSWTNIYVLHSNSAGPNSFTLPKATSNSGWKVVYSNTGANAVDTYLSGKITVGTNETLILVGNDYSENSLDVSNVKFNDASFIYDGTAKSLSVTNLPNGAKVTYTNNNQTEIGVYTVTATITDEEGNVLRTLTARLSITNGIDVSKVKFNDAAFIYDGAAKSLSVTNLPNGSKVTYTNNNQTEVGVYTVTATITDEEGNVLRTLTAKLSIISVTGSFLEIYNEYMEIAKNDMDLSSGYCSLAKEEFQAAYFDFIFSSYRDIQNLLDAYNNYCAIRDSVKNKDALAKEFASSFIIFPNEELENLYYALQK